MDLIGQIAIWILGIILFVKYLDYSSKKKQQLQARIKHFSKHSNRFRALLEKENLSIPISLEYMRGPERKALMRIIREIESDPEEQKNIKGSEGRSVQREICMKEKQQQMNYYAFHNIDIIKRLKKLRSPIREPDIQQMISDLRPKEDTSKVIEELLKNFIITCDSKNKQFHLGFNLSYIYHPYELDEQGNPKRVL